MGEKLKFKEVRTQPAPFTFRYSQWRSWDSHPSMSRSRAHAFPSMARGLPRWLSPKLGLGFDHRLSGGPCFRGCQFLQCSSNPILRQCIYPSRSRSLLIEMD